MFKVGDIVWAKVSKYLVTFYHRPCKVLNELGQYMRVEVLDNGSRFTVEKDNFEVITHDKIINCGDLVYHKGLEEYLIFMNYNDSGSIKCKNLFGVVGTYNIKYICKVGDLFYV